MFKGTMKIPFYSISLVLGRWVSVCRSLCLSVCLSLFLQYLERVGSEGVYLSSSLSLSLFLEDFVQLVTPKFVQKEK